MRGWELLGRKESKERQGDCSIPKIPKEGGIEAGGLCYHGCTKDDLCVKTTADLLAIFCSSGAFEK